MSLSRRAIVIGALALSACGFTPVYGPNGTATALQGAVLVDEPDTRDAYAFVEQMESRIGRASAPRYALSYTITTTEGGLAITGSNDITRFNIEGSLAYQITPVGSDVVLTQGSVRSFTAYSAGSSTISTLTSERDARKRLMIILADQVVTQMLVDPTLK